MDALKFFRFSSDLNMRDEYISEVENKYDGSAIYEKEFINGNSNDDPMLCLDIVAMLPMPPIRRHGRLNIRRSVSDHCIVKNIAITSIKYLAIITKVMHSFW